jgi:hypothetical protein
MRLLVTIGALAVAELLATNMAQLNLAATSPSSATAKTKTEGSADWEPPEELCSEDNNYCIKIIDAELPDKSAKGRIASDYPETETGTLVVSAKGQILAKYPTFGYLLSAFWSPDDGYVAVNNRRANGGDYIWILSLRDGAAIKVPEDLAPKSERRRLVTNYLEAVKKIRRTCPKCTEDNVTKSWLEARGWKGTNELTVRQDFRFVYGAETVSFTVSETYRVSADRFELRPAFDIPRGEDELRD